MRANARSTVTELEAERERDPSHLDVVVVDPRCKRHNTQRVFGEDAASDLQCVGEDANLQASSIVA